MGVPSFYRWLVKKYPKIVSDATVPPQDDAGFHSFDNLYLDMNGIIHPCFHPEDDLFPPTTFSEVFVRIHEYVDHLFDIVRPRKLLFMAIDGVAPRAKMNQQRARRLRASKDNQMAEELEEKLRHQFEKEGKALLPKERSQLFDSNVITPGTEFMHLLSENLQSYIRSRMVGNPAWGNIKVILSADNVPGEGEHKIMSFIRAQRSTPGYDPNTRHCLYGLDADLIMLALATHEIHFSILREEVQSPIDQHIQAKAQGHGHKSDSEKIVSHQQATWMVHKKQQHYQFLSLCVLREYLALEVKVTCPDKDLDLERIIDDFIFICFFAGNDFLPHMPSLEIHEGCIDLLMHVYKEGFENLGGYLVDMEMVEDKKGRFINLKRVERFILAVGAYEDKIFHKRSELRDRMLRKILLECNDAKEDERNALEDGRASDIVWSSIDVNEGTPGIVGSSSVSNADDAEANTRELKQKVKDSLKKQSDLLKNGVLGTDQVKFGKEGWKERYYRLKLNIESPDEIEMTRKSMVLKYGEGLCWALLYYFSGVPSMTWFYPYHYSPLASDCKGLSQTNVKFEKGLPFKPFDQLMGVLPPSSAHALPLAYKALMTNPSSSILDFYPTEFEVDMDGKRFTWQGISKLPFIEEDRLLAETSKLSNELKDSEKVRNTETMDLLFLRRTSKFGQQFGLDSCGTKLDSSEKVVGAMKSDCTIEGIKGIVHLMPDDLAAADDVFKDESAVDVLCLLYEVQQESLHIPRLLEGVNIPEKTVQGEDIGETILWHDSFGSNSNHNSRGQFQRPTRHNNHSLQPSSAMPKPTDNYRGAGRGFTSGRGKSWVDHDSGISSSNPRWNFGNNQPNRGPNPRAPNLRRPPLTGYNESGTSYARNFEQSTHDARTGPIRPPQLVPNYDFSRHVSATGFGRPAYAPRSGFTRSDNVQSRNPRNNWGGSSRPPAFFRNLEYNGRFRPPQMEHRANMGRLHISEVHVSRNTSPGNNVWSPRGGLSNANSIKDSRTVEVWGDDPPGPSWQEGSGPRQ